MVPIPVWLIVPIPERLIVPTPDVVMLPMPGVPMLSKPDDGPAPGPLPGRLTDGLPLPVCARRVGTDCTTITALGALLEKKAPSQWPLPERESTCARAGLAPTSSAAAAKSATFMGHLETSIRREEQEHNQCGTRTGVAVGIRDGHYEIDGGRRVFSQSGCDARLVFAIPTVGTKVFNQNRTARIVHANRDRYATDSFGCAGHSGLCRCGFLRRLLRSHQSIIGR